MMRVPLWAVISILATGCGGTNLVIDSDTSWAGAVDGFGSISGRGHAEYDLRDATTACWTVAKTTEAGTLRVYSSTSQWFGLGDEVNGEAKTTVPMGAVSGCAS